MEHLKIVGKLSPEETQSVIQSFGTAIDRTGGEESVVHHNKKLMEIAARFHCLDWNEIEIDPEGNVIDKTRD